MRGSVTKLTPTDSGTADSMAQVGTGFVLQKVGQAEFSTDPMGKYMWENLDLPNPFCNLEHKLCEAMCLPRRVAAAEDGEEDDAMEEGALIQRPGRQRPRRHDFEREMQRRLPPSVGIRSERKMAVSD